MPANVFELESSPSGEDLQESKCGFLFRLGLLRTNPERKAKSPFMLPPIRRQGEQCFSSYDEPMMATQHVYAAGLHYFRTMFRAKLPHQYYRALLTADRPGAVTPLSLAQA
ncbi:hypothetical protein HJFPF1_08106 [Paramyrothecium foliicola]|nr:hypothetical protein HJFPF1_08106 [Paramyrothecium foliicola]